MKTSSMKVKRKEEKRMATTRTKSLISTLGKIAHEIFETVEFGIKRKNKIKKKGERRSYLKIKWKL